MHIQEKVPLKQKALCISPTLCSSYAAMADNQSRLTFPGGRPFNTGCATCHRGQKKRTHLRMDYWGPKKETNKQKNHVCPLFLFAGVPLF